jgi:hypothetical protein
MRSLEVAGEDGGIFHNLEVLQCFAERAKGEKPESGRGASAGRAVGKPRRWTLVAQPSSTPRSRGHRRADPAGRRCRQCGASIEYNDGFRAAASCFLTGERVPVARSRIHSTLCYIPTENSNNFSPLVTRRALFTTGRD